MKNDDERPDCFGRLDKVFPMTDSGLRQTPEDCFYHCPVKTLCLQHAMATKDGTAVEEELLERGSRSGLVNFFERWSRKKQMHKKLNRKKT